MAGNGHAIGCNCPYCRGYAYEYGNSGGGSVYSYSHNHTVNEASLAPRSNQTRWSIKNVNTKAECSCKTTCSKCGADVYFVRHNGGSVWFDKLGQPWPKHPCYDIDNNSIVLSGKLSSIGKDMFVSVGVAVQQITDNETSWKAVTVEYADSKRMVICFESKSNDIAIGELLIVIGEKNDIINIKIQKVCASDFIIEGIIYKMKYRRFRAREIALQLLFQNDVNKKPMSKQAVVEFVANRVSDIGLTAFTLAIYDGVLKHRAAIDERIVKTAENWRLSRMNPSDRNVLRLGIFELYHAESPEPMAVILNEAIELARRYGSEDSPAFVNGILDAVAKSLTPAL